MVDKLKISKNAIEILKEKIVYNAKVKKWNEYFSNEVCPKCGSIKIELSHNGRGTDRCLDCKAGSVNYK